MRCIDADGDAQGDNLRQYEIKARPVYCFSALRFFFLIFSSPFPFIPAPYLPVFCEGAESASPRCRGFLPGWSLGQDRPPLTLLMTLCNARRVSLSGKVVGSKY